MPSARRTAAGYRVYDSESLARLELARTLRDLGLGLPQIREVLEREHTLAEVAAVHVDALEVQIRALRTQQAVLRSVTRRYTTAEGLAFMSRTARLSAAERRTLIHDFLTETLRCWCTAGTWPRPWGTHATSSRPSPSQPCRWVRVDAGSRLGLVRSYASRQAS
ncbi:MerR family transcriptional regulator [Streptomyces sp. NPDC001633]|uniref:MerR family transcriptional regulator n=1 Tax=Streptomyces sp. NPDC001633 TaxID=3364595 RepID=UPI00369F079F